MASIFNDSDLQQFITRINRLQPDTRNEWGKMTVSQMLAHCQQPLRVALGEVKLKRSLIGILFGKIAKKKILSPKGFDRNLPTSPHFVIKDERVFEKEKAALIELMKKISKGGKDSISKDEHPFFGKMSADEWDQLQVKHLDHHLRQFGA
jgi:hypothetical protein